jgi:2-amino-4-hydroxy-6-hydroxymethyldihydropteridine diphosphokinase
MRAYVGVGTNLGDRWRHLALARRALQAVPGVAVLRASHVYDNAALDPAQPRFLNAALELETDRPAEPLLILLLRIEDRAHRRREVRWAPRTLDLDLLLYEDAIVQTPRLTLPHPGLAARRFVLEPLAELCPGRSVPGTGATVAELLRAAPAHELRVVGAYPG